MAEVATVADGAAAMIETDAAAEIAADVVAVAATAVTGTVVEIVIEVRAGTTTARVRIGVRARIVHR